MTPENPADDIESTTGATPDDASSTASADRKVPGDYGADAIQILEGLEAVRKRPGMYIGSTGPRGLHHLVYEIVDNSVDEALAGYADNIDVTILEDGGIRVINLARGEIVQDDAMIPALETGRVAAYITDFPNNRLLAAPHVVAMPHLGASTPESEQNCAVMAADELKDYLETGNVRNSVNLPAVSMTPSGVMRLCILHKNVPGMLANITTLFGRDGVNVENLSNKSKGDWAYTMVDLAAHIGDDVLQDVRAMEHVVRVRAINW